MSGTKKESGEEKLLLSGTKTAAEILPGVETLEPELVIANAVQEIEEEIAQEETHAGQMEGICEDRIFGGNEKSRGNQKSWGNEKPLRKRKFPGKKKIPGKQRAPWEQKIPGEWKDSGK